MSCCTFSYVLLHACTCPVECLFMSCCMDAHVLLHVLVCPVTYTTHPVDRFKDPETLFEPLLKLFNKYPITLQWCVDKGRQQADKLRLYRQFLDATEQCIRNVALSGSRLFRTGSMDSAEKWRGVDLWRKHRVIVFVWKFFHKRPNLRPFDRFRERDYIERNRLIKTYNIRHREMTQGKSRRRYGLRNPTKWSQNPNVDDRIDPDDVVSDKHAPKDFGSFSQKKLLYDSDEEDWVQVGMLCVDCTCPVLCMRMSCCMHENVLLHECVCPAIH